MGAIKGASGSSIGVRSQGKYIKDTTSCGRISCLGTRFDAALRATLLRAHSLLHSLSLAILRDEISRENSRRNFYLYTRYFYFIHVHNTHLQKKKTYTPQKDTKLLKIFPSGNFLFAPLNLKLNRPI